MVKACPKDGRTIFQDHNPSETRWNPSISHIQTRYRENLALMCTLYFGMCFQDLGIQLNFQNKSCHKCKPHMRYSR